MYECHECGNGTPATQWVHFLRVSSDESVLESDDLVCDEHLAQLQGQSFQVLSAEALN